MADGAGREQTNDRRLLAIAGVFTKFGRDIEREMTRFLDINGLIAKSNFERLVITAGGVANASGYRATVFGRMRLGARPNAIIV